MSRLENAPSKIEIARLMAAMVDQFCDSYAAFRQTVLWDSPWTSGAEVIIYSLP
jgi:hypothetical protein